VTADLAPDAGIAALERHFRQAMSGYDYNAQRNEPVRVPVPGSPISALTAPPGGAADPAEAAAGAELEWQAQLGVQIGALAHQVGALHRAHDAARVAWQELHPFDLPFASASQSTAAGQTLTSETWGPRTGWAWDVRRVTVQGLNGPVTTTQTGTGTIAAGAGSATLPAGASVTGFTLTFSAAMSVAGTATLSNVAGGPITFAIPSGQLAPYTVTFPQPIAASSAAAIPTLTVAGGGTGAGNIALYGSTSTAADIVTIYKAPVAAASGAVPLAAIDNITGSGAGSDLLITQKGAFLMQQGDALLVAGAYTAANIAVSASGAEVALHRLPWYLK
jgi:hypothetical protein